MSFHEHRLAALFEIRTTLLHLRLVLFILSNGTNRTFPLRHAIAHHTLATRPFP